MVAGELLALGCTNLEAKIGAHVAQFGARACFQNYQRLSELLVRPDGGRYHFDSIGRAWRRFVARGLGTHERFFAGQTPKFADYHTPHGTTEKRIVWSALGLKNPVSKRAAREMQRQADAHERAHRAGLLGRTAAAEGARPEASQAAAAPRYYTPAQCPTPPADPKTEAAHDYFRAVAERVINRKDARDAAAVAQRDAEQVSTSERGPPPD